MYVGSTEYPLSLLPQILQERSLRATQYLPDIVKLQRSLYDAFHHRLDRKEAKTITIGQYLKSLKNGMFTCYIVNRTSYKFLAVHFISENSRNECNERIASLRKAWALVGTDLKTHGNYSDVL